MRSDEPEVGILNSNLGVLYELTYEEEPMVKAIISSPQTIPTIKC